MLSPKYQSVSHSESSSSSSSSLSFSTSFLFFLFLIIFKLLPPLVHISYTVTRPLSQNHQTHWFITYVLTSQHCHLSAYFKESELNIKIKILLIFVNKVCSEWCLCTSLLAADDDAPRNYNSTQHHHRQQNQHQHHHQINIIINIIIASIIIISSSIKSLMVANNELRANSV